MRRAHLYSLAVLFAVSSVRAEPRAVQVPLFVPNAFLEHLLVEQVFTEPGATAQLTAIADPCNEVVLSEPRVGHAGGRLLVTAHARADAGLSWFGECLGIASWEGEIEAEETVRVAPDAPVLWFSVENSSLRGEGGFFHVPALWDWVKPLVHPRLEMLSVDLGPLVRELQHTLPAFASHPEQEAVQRLVASLALTDAQVEERGLMLQLGFEVDAASPGESRAALEPPLSPEQLHAFEDALFAWDAFVTFAVKVATREALSREQRALLLAALLDAREELVVALAEPSGSGSDRVRALFQTTWTQLAPIFAGLEAGKSGWRFLAFVASGDALAALDAASPRFGFEISSGGLRRLARTLAPDVAGDPLAWNQDVDPELREGFGFDAVLPALPPPEEGEVITEPGLEAVPSGATGEPPGEVTPPWLPQESLPEEEPPMEELPLAPPPEAAPPELEPEAPMSWLERIGAALASLIVATPAYASPGETPPPEPTASPLDGRVPRLADLDRYLPQVAELLDEAASQVFAQSRLGKEHRDLFRHLVLATAWQESCWRQYTMRRGAVVTLRSSAGALGLMQVNPHVWRGFYAVDGLTRSIRYNAHAGSEILLHYLRDYAIARGEGKRGVPDAIARASYAAYNGGPRHLRRYREPKRWGASLAAIDAAFLAKYHTVAKGGALGVRECFPG